MPIHQWGKFPKVLIPTRGNMDQENVPILGECIALWGKPMSLVYSIMFTSLYNM